MTGFDSLGLHDHVVRGVYTYGFEEPSPIQKALVPELSKGRDCVAQAPSGTGKTAAFGVGVLQRSTSERQNALVLVPTRELARQISGVISELAKYTVVGVECCVGGHGSKTDDIRRLRNHDLFVMVATPGRGLDVLQSDEFLTRTIATIVMDEADHLLAQETFQELTRQIFSKLPKDACVCVCSATMPASLEVTCDHFMRADRFVHKCVDTKALVLQGIMQYQLKTPSMLQKIEAMEALYQSWAISASIVFCNSRSRVDWLADQMESRGYAVGRMHGNLKDSERLAVMREFRSGGTRVLIATHLLARGIDVQKVDLVVLYDMIHDPDTYLHAIGRCGRYGRKGVSVVLVEPNETDTAATATMVEKFGVSLTDIPADMRIPEMQPL